MHNTRFNSPVLGDEAKESYSIYGEPGDVFINYLENAPSEMAVISRMLAYLNKLLTTDASLETETTE